MEVHLKNVRLAFPALFEAKAVAGSDSAKYSAAFLFEKGSVTYKNLTAAELAVAKEKWGAKAESVLKTIVASAKQLVKDGDSKAEYAGYEGLFFVNSSNSARPTVVDGQRAPLTAADGKPYGGCYVNAIVDVWAQDNQYGKRINASLKGVQFLKDGDPFGAGGVASADQFDEVDDGANADDSLVG